MKKWIRLAAIGMAVSVLTGCGGAADTELETITLDTYERTTYETAEVMQGDLIPMVSLQLTPSAKESVTYQPLKDNMEVKQVYVKNGDYVQKGDVMVTFKSEEVDEKIKQYNEEVDMMVMLVEHYEKLMEVNDELDYKDDIEQLKKDIDIKRMYISEENAKLSSYSIKAERSGVVSSVSDLLYYGTVGLGDKVVTVIYNEGDYYDATTDDYPFQVGDIYEAKASLGTFEVELTSIEDGNTSRTLHFRPLDMRNTANINLLELNIIKDVKKNVVYIPQKCVMELGETTFVYCLSEEGYKIPVEIEVGEEVEDNIIVNSGLKAGDRVVIN